LAVDVMTDALQVLETLSGTVSMPLSANVLSHSTCLPLFLFLY